MVHYPVDFPGDAARLIVKNFRANTIVSQRAETAEAAWNLVGYGLSYTIGTPATGIMMSVDPSLDNNVPPDEEMIALLESHDAAPADEKLRAGLPIPAALLIKWAMNLAIRIISNSF